MSKKPSHLPNYLTAARILGSIAMLLPQPLSTGFMLLYTACGLTDVLDGWIARKTFSQTALGAKLDSIADLCFYSVMLLRLLPILFGRLPWGIWVAVGAIVLVRIAAYWVAGVKYRRFAALHSYGNKLTGLMLFLLPFLMNSQALFPYSVAVCAAAGLSSAEELIIHITSANYDPNRKSLFLKKPIGR